MDENFFQSNFTIVITSFSSLKKRMNGLKNIDHFFQGSAEFLANSVQLFVFFR
jgi:hypothetical protein